MLCSFPIVHRSVACCRPGCPHAHSAVELGASLPWRDDGSNIGPRLSSKLSLKTLTIKHQTLPPSLARAGRVQGRCYYKAEWFWVKYCDWEFEFSSGGSNLNMLSFAVLKYDLLHREAHIWGWGFELRFSNNNNP